MRKWILPQMTILNLIMKAKPVISLIMKVMMRIILIFPLKTKWKGEEAEDMGFPKTIKPSPPQTELTLSAMVTMFRYSRFWQTQMI